MKPTLTGDKVAWKGLITRDRRIEIGRIIGTAIVIGLYWWGLFPDWCLWLAVAIGLYPLLKTGINDLLYERKIGTEIFVTIATLIALLGGEAIAGAVLMVIILIAEFIAELNTDRARASIRGLIGAIPQTAAVRRDGGEKTIPIEQLRIGDVVLVKAGEKIPVDGRVVTGSGSVNEAPITGESLPRDKESGSEVFAGTVLESGALDVETAKVGADTTFARIVKLVEEAEESQAPVQKLADRVAGWLIPVVFVFLVVVYRDRAGDVCDFHSLRHTFISRIVSGGASVKVAQDLARHSTPVLTIGRYAHSRLHDLRDALDGLPPLKPTTETEPATMAATGTDSRDVFQRGESSQRQAQRAGRFSVRMGATRGDDPSKEPETVDRRKSLPDTKKGDVERRLARECERGPGESRTHAGGFAIRLHGTENTEESDENEHRAAPGAAICAAIHADDPELFELIHAWPTLPEAIKSVVGAMVRAVDEGIHQGDGRR